MVKDTRPSQLMETNMAHQRTAAKINNQVMAAKVLLNTVVDILAAMPLKSMEQNILRVTLRNQFMDIAAASIPQIMLRSRLMSTLL